MMDGLYKIKSLMSRMYEIDGNYTYSYMLNEDRASKQSDKARRVIKGIFGDKYYWDKNFQLTNKSVINTFEEYLRQVMKIKSKNYPDSTVSYEFEPGIARICYGELFLDPYDNDGLWGLIDSFRKCMEYISENCPDEYDGNLNGYSLRDFFEKYPHFFTDDKESDVSVGKTIMGLKCGRYTINQVDTFFDAMKYLRYFEDNEKDAWCLTKSQSAFNMYSNDFNNKIYFCLADGFEDAEPLEGENYPYDAYGMSMVSVIVNKNGGPVAITLRWNHHDDAPGDNAFDLDKSRFTSKTGITFDSVFAPYTSDEKDKLRKQINGLGGKITDKDYLHLLKDGTFVADEIETYEGGYQILYRHKDNIRFEGEEDGWVYVDSDPEGDEYEPASLTDNSYAYLVDRDKRKIIGRIDNPERSILRNEIHFLAAVNNKLFSSAKRGFIIGEGFPILRTIAGYVYEYDRDGKGFYVVDPCSGNVLNDKLFNRILFYDGRRNSGSASLFALDDGENYLFLFFGRKSPMDKLWVKKEDVLYNMNNYFVVFNKEGKTCAYNSLFNKFKELDGLYTEIGDVDYGYGSNTFSAKLSNEAGCCISLYMSNNGSIYSSVCNDGNNENEFHEMVGDNRTVFKLKGTGLYNIYDSKIGAYVFTEPFAIIDDDFARFGHSVYFKNEQVYRVFDRNYRKCFLTSKEKPVAFVYRFDYTMFGLARGDVPKKAIVFDNHKNEILPLNVTNPEFANSGIIEISDGQGNHDVFTCSSGVLERPDEFKDKDLWDLRLETENGGIRVVYTNKRNGERHSIGPIRG